jgi:hypothetical protein
MHGSLLESASPVYLIRKHDSGPAQRVVVRIDGAFVKARRSRTDKDSSLRGSVRDRLTTASSFDIAESRA